MCLPQILDESRHVGWLVSTQYTVQLCWCSDMWELSRHVVVEWRQRGNALVAMGCRGTACYRSMRPTESSTLGGSRMRREIHVSMWKRFVGGLFSVSLIAHDALGAHYLSSKLHAAADNTLQYFQILWNVTEMGSMFWIVGVGECASNPCVHGVCVDGENLYTCQCNSDWGGVNCDIPRSSGGLSKHFPSLLQNVFYMRQE